MEPARRRVRRHSSAESSESAPRAAKNEGERQKAEETAVSARLRAFRATSARVQLVQDDRIPFRIEEVQHAAVRAVNEPTLKGDASLA